MKSVKKASRFSLMGTGKDGSQGLLMNLPKSIQVHPGRRFSLETEGD